MSPQLAKKLLVISIGVLLLLLAALYQIQNQSLNTRPVLKNSAQNQDVTPLLRNSLLQQKRNFQRCWLQNAPTTTDQTQIWQMYLTIEPSGKVKHFELLNKALFNPDTEKCLRNISLRLKFPAFQGEEISFTIPITISALNENH